MVAGYDNRFLPKGSLSSVKKEDDLLVNGKIKEKGNFVGMVVDMDNKTISYVVDGQEKILYSNIGAKELFLFVCCAHYTTSNFNTILFLLLFLFSFIFNF